MIPRAHCPVCGDASKVRYGQCSWHGYLSDLHAAYRAGMTYTDAALIEFLDICDKAMDDIPLVVEDDRQATAMHTILLNLGLVRHVVEQRAALAQRERKPDGKPRTSSDQA